jgi:hypothetical protein
VGPRQLGLLSCCVCGQPERVCPSHLLKKRVQVRCHTGGRGGHALLVCMCRGLVALLCRTNPLDAGKASLRACKRRGGVLLR